MSKVEDQSTYLDLTFPQTDIEARVVAFDAEGNEVAVSRVCIYPIFYTPKQSTNVVFASLRGPDAGRIVDRQKFVISVSGQTGRCKISQRSDPVTPFFSQPDDESEEVSECFPDDEGTASKRKKK